MIAENKKPRPNYVVITKNLDKAAPDGIEELESTPVATAFTMNPWIRCVVLVLMILAPSMAYCLIFSSMGLGIRTHRFFLRNDWTCDLPWVAEDCSPLPIHILRALCVGACCILFGLGWLTSCTRFRRVMYSIGATFLLLGLLYCIDIFPYASLLFFLMLGGVYIGVIRTLLECSNTQGEDFESALVLPLVISGFILMATWLSYVGVAGDTGSYSEISGQLGCGNSTLAEVSHEWSEEHCSRLVFVLWVCPLLCAGLNLFLAALIQFDAQELLKARAEGHKSASLVSAPVRIILYVTVFSMTAVYVNFAMLGSSLTGNQVTKTDMILSLVVVVLFVSALPVTVTGINNADALKQKLLGIPLVEKIAESIFTDWPKAALVLCCLPFFMALYLVLTINEGVRNCRIHRATVKHDKNSNASTYAERVELAKKHYRKPVCLGCYCVFCSDRIIHQSECMHDVHESLGRWQWDGILVKSVWVGVFFVGWQVGVGKCTTLFLSWLNIYLQDYELTTVLVLFACVGIFMFLLPPVPGVPVYLSGGIIITNAARATFGFWGGIVLASAVCFGLKLVAVVLQQKGIGGMLGQFTSVRAMVGYNSITIRAIGHILRQPGISTAKVCILCGGPDWPTSVLTGILNLRLSSMLCGTMPVVLVITPTVMAGAMLLRAGESEMFASMSKMVLIAAGIVQGVGTILAMHFIHLAGFRHEAELEAMEDDPKVAAMEAKSAKRAAEYRAATDWHSKRFPLVAKICLWLAVICMTITCFMLGYYGAMAFEKFEITDSIDEKLDGEAINIIKPFGVLALYMFCASLLLLWLYKQWAGHAAKVYRRTLDGSSMDDLVQSNRHSPKHMSHSPKKTII